MLWMTLALAGDNEDWSDSIIDQIEDYIDEVDDIAEGAREAQDHQALSCIALQAGSLESSLMRAEQAAERLETAEHDENAYAVNTEIMVMQAEYERARDAWGSVHLCGGQYAPSGGNSMNLSGVLPAPQLLLGGGWSTDPLVSDGASGSVMLASLSLYESVDRSRVEGKVDGRVSAERWPQQAERDHWAAVDGGLELRYFPPEGRLHLVMEEDLVRHPTTTGTWVPGVTGLVQHRGMVGLEAGRHDYRRAVAAFTHRYDRALLADGEDRRVQAWGGQGELRMPTGIFAPGALGRIERLDHRGVGGTALTGMLTLRMAHFASYALLEGGGGFARYQYEDLFQPILGWQAYGQLSITGNGSGFGFGVGWHRKLVDDWRGQGVVERGWGGYLGAPLPGPFGLWVSAKRMSSTMDDAPVVLVEVESALSLSRDGPVALELRGHHRSLSGGYEGRDTGGTLVLILGE